MNIDSNRLYSVDHNNIGDFRLIGRLCFLLHQQTVGCNFTNTGSNANHHQLAVPIYQIVFIHGAMHLWHSPTPFQFSDETIPTWIIKSSAVPYDALNLYISGGEDLGSFFCLILPDCDSVDHDVLDSMAEHNLLIVIS